jgi:hypothetical protein
MKQFLLLFGCRTNSGMVIFEDQDDQDYRDKTRTRLTVTDGVPYPVYPRINLSGLAG